MPLRAGADPLVATSSGRWRGTAEGGLHVFRGIRYGADARRFRFRPAPPARSGDAQAATAFAPSAPQRGDPGQPTSEDCLFLNIWTPDARPGGRRPVMVYFHGGAYSGGTVNTPLTDGRHLAAGQDVVVVTVNHRLNALGYLYLARLDARFPASGNVGQHDLMLALAWVRGNIAQFGGDPSRVMLFGQSGGGAKIATLMAMPAAAGLFHAAATMSGQQVTASGPLNATRRAQAFIGRLAADPVTAPVERLVQALDTVDPIIGGSLYFGPVLDMDALRRHPFWPDAAPQSLAIPMVLGNTLDETRAFIDPRSEKVRTLDWGNLAERIAPEIRIDLKPEWIVAEYRRQFPGWSPERIFYAATTAGRSWPGQVIEADARAAAGAAATWVYQLDFQSPVDPLKGAPHTHDIPLVFGTLDAPGSLTGAGADARRLSADMMARFAALARTGQPDAAAAGRGGALPWPAYALPDRQTMRFDAISRAEADPRGFERRLFATAPYIQPGS